MNLEEIKDMGHQIVSNRLIAFDTETTGFNVFKGARPFLCTWSEGDKNYYTKNIEEVRYLLEDPTIDKVFQNGKFDLKMFRMMGIEVKGQIYDTMIMAHLYNENLPSKSLEHLAKTFLGEEKLGDSIEQWFKKNKIKKEERNYADVPDEIMIPYALKDTELTLKLYHYFEPKLKEWKLWPLFLNECELVRVLVDMEMRGLEIDVEYFEKLKVEFELELARVQGEIFALVGCEFDVLSSKQLGEVFSKEGIILNLSPKGNSEADKEALSKINHPLSCLVLEYRNKSKMLSTYINGLLDAQINNIVRCELYQIGARTGRFSCVTEDTLVTTEDGDKKIIDIKIGDMVLTHKGRYREVEAVHRNGNKDVFEITFNNGSSLKCTLDHRLLSSDNIWRSIERCVKELEEGIQLTFQGNGDEDVFIIDKINYIGTKFVYDLTVAEDHSYCTNGVFSHNCFAPNLQTIPKSDKIIRKGFINRKDYFNFYFDFSQMEIVIFVGYAQDKKLAKLLKDGLDYHQFIADDLGLTEAYGEAGRSKAKTLNFGLIFNMGTVKLMHSLEFILTEEDYKDIKAIEEGQSYYRWYFKRFKKEPFELTDENCIKYSKAKAIKTKYFSRFTTVETLLKNANDTILNRGYVFNKFGRRRRLSKEEAYKAVNSLVQGTGADIIKAAMVEVHNLLLPKKSNMLLQIHDELFCEIHKSELHLVPKIQEIMERCGNLFEAPLKVGIDWTKTNWAEKKKFISEEEVLS